jgi:signal transduction histidine kinase
MSDERDALQIVVFGDVSLPALPAGVTVVMTDDIAAVVEAAGATVWPLIVTSVTRLGELPPLPRALVVAGCQTPEEGLLAASFVALPLWDASASELALATACVARQRLRTLSLEVEATAADHEDFAHAVSHDLKGPLQGIIGLAGLLMEQSGVRVFPEVESYAGRIEGEADRLAAMVSALTAYARLGRPRPTLQPVALGPLVDTLSASAIRRHTHRFPRFKVAPEIGAVHANEELLSVAIDALIDNAVRFTEPGPLTISVGWVAGPEGRGRLTITDAGIGISERGTEDVFEMFTRLDKRRPDGIGVGLTMARRATQLCGGTISLTSTLGEGTTVTLELALAD